MEFVKDAVLATISVGQAACLALLTAPAATQVVTAQDAIVGTSLLIQALVSNALRAVEAVLTANVLTAYWRLITQGAVQAIAPHVTRASVSTVKMTTG